MEAHVPTVEEPVRILSDLHLAHPASRLQRTESLRGLLAGARTVIFNGDTCEQKCVAWLERGEGMRQELEELCGLLGIEAIFVAGNHDPFISSRGWLELYGGQVLVTHGHMIFPRSAPWSHEYIRNRTRILELLAEREEQGVGQDGDLTYRWRTAELVTEEMVPPPSPALGRRGRRYPLTAIWPPRRALNIAWVWATMVAQTSKFTEHYRPQARFVLSGHFHRSGIWKRRGRVLCNTGAFMRGSRPLAIDIQGGRLSVRRVERDGQEWRLAPAHAEFLLEEKRTARS